VPQIGQGQDGRVWELVTAVLAEVALHSAWHEAHSSQQVHGQSGQHSSQHATGFAAEGVRAAWSGSLIAQAAEALAKRPTTVSIIKRRCMEHSSL
jgi:hypothetical protein